MIELKGEKFFDTEEAGKRLGLHQRTVTKYIREKKLKAVKIGVKYYLSERLIAEHLGMADPNSTLSIIERRYITVKTEAETFLEALTEVETNKNWKIQEVIRYLNQSYTKKAAEAAFWFDEFRKGIEEKG